MQGEKPETHKKTHKKAKPVDASHLLGFQIAHEPESTQSIYKDRRRSYIPSLSKEKYVHANFKFVVNPAADYESLASNSDKLIDWDAIELVVCTMFEVYECPICLEKELLAPRMTRCGHIFCLTCIKQHVKHHTSSFTLPKCPLCYAQIETQHLRACQLVPVRIPKEGETIELHLVSRQKRSTVLQDEAMRKKGVQPHLYVPGTVPFSRAVLTYDIKPIIENERKQLNEALWLANSCQELYLIPFLEEGLIELEQRQAAFSKRFSSTKPGTEGGEYVYTYQVSWGDNMFLLPLNFKCLLDEYQRYEYLPVVIKAPVVEIGHYRLDHSNRKKYKFLEHLPLQSTFSFVEVNLKEYLSEETLEIHKAALQDRENYRLAQKQKEQELEKLMPQNKKIIDYIKETDAKEIYEFPVVIRSGPDEEELKEKIKTPPVEEEKVVESKEESIWTKDNIKRGATHQVVTVVNKKDKELAKAMKSKKQTKEDEEGLAQKDLFFELDLTKMAIPSKKKKKGKKIVTTQ